MKLTKYAAAATAVAAALTLAACSGEDASSTASSTAAATTTAVQEQAPLPTAEELNGILALAMDPNVPIEERVQTVEGGETAPELFDVLAANQVASGASLYVVEPILQYTPDSVLATVVVQYPEEAQPQKGEDVEFVFQDGRWKLSRTWACMIVGFVVPPEQVPPVCQTDEFGAPAPEAPVEAPVEAPAPEAPVEEAPAQ
ncbi:hypothetical protein [Corynebacterium kozikiae]|uniref:hypothetical protein n=1 Tax=Corynebacterium kozikiae TaxID=2968469 RepID=UPI00211C9838|nr:hypothetical protein [Corynebacterium sp. 76QC2CO]